MEANFLFFISVNIQYLTGKYVLLRKENITVQKMKIFSILFDRNYKNKT